MYQNYVVYSLFLDFRVAHRILHIPPVDNPHGPTPAFIGCTRIKGPKYYKSGGGRRRKSAQDRILSKFRSGDSPGTFRSVY